MDEWLNKAGATKVGDIIYDGAAMITKIDKGLIDFSIDIRPTTTRINLGKGYGKLFTIRFADFIQDIEFIDKIDKVNINIISDDKRD